MGSFCSLNPGLALKLARPIDVAAVTPCQSKPQPWETSRAFTLSHEPPPGPKAIAWLVDWRDVGREPRCSEQQLADPWKQSCLSDCRSMTELSSDAGCPSRPTGRELYGTLCCVTQYIVIRTVHGTVTRTLFYMTQYVVIRTVHGTVTRRLFYMI